MIGVARLEEDFAERVADHRFKEAIAKHLNTGVVLKADAQEDVRRPVLLELCCQGLC